MDMNEAEAIKLLKVEQKNVDMQAAHMQADRILCQLLQNFGYDDVVDEYDKVRKWYA